MKVIFLFLLTVVFVSDAFTQKRRPSGKLRPLTSSVQKPKEVGQTGFVVDETLSVLRTSPSLYAEPIQRMRRGRAVRILAVSEANGVRFYRVAAPPSSAGWVQADAVFGKFRSSDEERLVRLVQASEGFEQIEIAVEFFNLFPESKFKPAVLLLFGDLLEVTAAKLSRDASNRLSRTEMAATAAPLHSYYLNFVSLDRYRKLGIVFLFNSSTKTYHYDGSGWRVVVSKFPASPEATEAQKRLDQLKQKLESQPAKK
ncbi:MAG: SH3 domain-containing protein [Blastocatellia bacterium]